MDSGCLEEDGCFFYYLVLNLIISLCFFFFRNIIFKKRKKILSFFCLGVFPRETNLNLIYLGVAVKPSNLCKRRRI